MDKKKKRELEQLRTYYPKYRFSITKASENPDFILRDNINDTLFGVEVTAYYDSPTSGRFKNIPDYIKKLTDKIFIHKEDRGILERIDTLELIKDDSSTEPMPVGIMRQLPQSIERIKELKKLVANKNLKYSNYDKSLERIDLLIFDDGDLIAGADVQKKEILNYLRGQAKANTLASPFKNIILIIKENTGQNISIILKSST